MGNMKWCNCCCLGMRLCCSFLISLQLLFLCVDAQNPDSNGFISIDCGHPSNKSYLNSFTGLTYISDDQFIDTGINGVISSLYSVDQTVYPYLNNVRSFPNGTKNCYQIMLATEGSKFLIRAWFYYGNYDQLDILPRFDLYLGVNKWDTVEFSAPNIFQTKEMIAITPTNYIQVCLINTGLGTPFISALEVRPLNSTLYEPANSTQSLTLYARGNVGSNKIWLRYPDDTLDRLWPNYTASSWKALSTSSNIDGFTFNEVPGSLLQTAAVSSTSISPMDITWQIDDNSDISNICYVVLYFAEIEILQNTSLREFYVYADGKQMSSNPVPVQKYLKSANYSYTDTGHTSYTMSLKSSTRATLPPILNAIEIYIILPVTVLPTDYRDVTAINSIKVNYSIKKDWSGDPCVPTSFSWTGVNCTMNSSNISRITALNLSSSGLTGAMVSAFGKLIELETLNLSHNNLLGDIPSSLDQLTSLKNLDLSGNTGLSRTLPPSLQKKQNDGQLTVIDNFNSTSIGSDHKNSWKIVIFGILAVLVVLLIVGAVALFLSYLKKNRIKKGLDFNKKQFSYAELKLITNDFTETIGVGGFGKVFKGQLGDRNIVAVKVSSESSSLGIEQFLNEVEKLSRVHHKNVVSLVGYCKDKNHIALVYEYMQGGNLQEWLRGKVSSLSWKQRLQIAYESAQGLEYLHKMCNPPLIHRDVKTSNILLTGNLEAKVSDFGLVRDCSSTHVSTRVAGTRGYLDPYYASTNQLTEKSDVYSFGVVLLEIITGKPPIGQGLQLGLHLTQFVQKMLSKENIESILDPTMGSQYNINSISKVTDLALRCTDHPTKRPDMTIIVRELNDDLNLEKFSNESSSVVSGGTSEYSGYVTCNNPVDGVTPSGSSESSTTTNNLEKFSIGTSSAASGPTSEYDGYSINDKTVGGVIPRVSFEMAHIGGTQVLDYDQSLR